MEYDELELDTLGEKKTVLWKGQKQDTRHSPIAKLNVPDARRVLSKDFPALILSQWAGNLYIKALSLSKNKS